MEAILILLLSYIIGILGWIFLVFFDKTIQTYNDLLNELKGTPAFIPIANILTFVGCFVIYIFVLTIYPLYKILFIEKLWNKIKDKKIKSWMKNTK